MFTTVRVCVCVLCIVCVCVCVCVCGCVCILYNSLLYIPCIIMPSMVIRGIGFAFPYFPMQKCLAKWPGKLLLERRRCHEIIELVCSTEKGKWEGHPIC